MSDNEVYVVAPKTDDGSVPGASEIYDDRVFFSRSEAEQALQDFQPFQRSNYEIYTAKVSIEAVDVPAPFIMPDLSEKVPDVGNDADLDDDDNDLDDDDDI